MALKIDQRKIKTRSRLRNALLSLLRYHKFEDITLTKISKHAEVNRVTFYSHYHDKYELLEDVIDNTLKGFQESVIGIPKKGGIHGNQKEQSILMAMLTYIHDHSLFFKTMLSERRIPGFIPLFISCIEETYKHFLLSDKKIIDLEIYRKYVTSATIGLISYWIKTEMKDSPAYLAQQFINLQNINPPNMLFINLLNQPKAQVLRTEDRRVQRSRQNLQDALLLLINEKGYEAITITDICNKANYNRATFYAHYKNKMELASELMDEKILDLLHFMNTPLPKDRTQQGDNKFQAIEQIFYYVAKQEVFFKVMFSGRTVPGFLAKLRCQLGMFFQKKLHSCMHGLGPECTNLEILIDCITFSIIGTVSYWVRCGMKLPPAYMSEQVILILNHNSNDREIFKEN
ncbi:TetR/AcrR family transcriptional regulator [Peribacillus glennii]|uniref:TetR family transcriptional regulator n=1 Tax=Peribacillus glennii TaxID=2303991 RepID=A0A372LEI2_9BACI|nr:TetR/AcrR family transcriptional regulator C-terminal domain-containing protein [Peribacillus glennii]RFU64708.1 TetR family transcriptional regulator [Peribacillus glennii]